MRPEIAKKLQGPSELYLAGFSWPWSCDSCQNQSILVKRFPYPYTLSLHYSREWIADEFFVRARQGCDEDRIWLDRETDSKVFSEVHGRILTRRETLRVSA
jgi:hypothetical protein